MIFLLLVPPILVSNLLLILSALWSFKVLTVITPLSLLYCKKLTVNNESATCVTNE
jgi:hypothetical protein